MSRILCAVMLFAGSVGSAAGQGFESGQFTFGGESFAESAGIQVTADVTPIDATQADLNVTVTLPPHNYIYSTTSPFGIPTAFKVANGLEVIGKPKADRDPKVVEEPGLGTMEKFYDKATWTLRIRKSNGSWTPGETISGDLTGQYCSDGADGGVCKPIRPPAAFEAKIPADFVATATPAEVGELRGGAQSSSVVVVPEMRLPAGLDAPPIRFNVSLAPESPAAGDAVKLQIRADIDQPYHTYSITQPKSDFGPLPTELVLSSISGLEPVGDQFKAEPAPELKPSEFDDGTMEVHHDSVTWTHEFTMTGESAAVSGTIVFQICNKSSCLPQAEVKFTVATSGADAGLAAAGLSPGGDPAEFGGGGESQGWLGFIIAAIGAGFAALVTPCVYPMIPVTISYFLKQGEQRPGETIKLAFTYFASIVGAFTVIGLAVAILFGGHAIQGIANDKWLNLFLAGVFTVFALMLMGMFEVRVPSWLLTWTSKKQEAGGYMGVVFMALTFTLVSFTCTFVFVGQLLVAATDGSYLRPIIGMMAFSMAFASPFFLLALFPSLLHRMPKSGGWMNRVKVTLGLAEIAIVTKFLSVADTGFSPTGTPMFLDYHLVVASWIVVSIVTGMYLLGVFYTPHDAPNQPVGAVQCMFAMGFMGIGAYLLVGLFSPAPPEGVLWQQVAAFAPPQLDVTTSEEGYFVQHDGLEYSLDFDAAVEVASQENTPMFLDFTGVNCVNCRQMERVVLAQEEVHSVLKDLVRVQLYTDLVPGVAKTSPEHDRLLKRNQHLQEEWLDDVAIPIYVIATPDGSEILATFKGKDTTNGRLFNEFLNTGLKRWQEKRSMVAQAGAEAPLLSHPSMLPATADADGSKKESPVPVRQASLNSKAARSDILRIVP